MNADEDVRARIAKFEAWIAHLEKARERYASRQRLYNRFFAAMVATSLLGFFRSSYTGLWGLISASVVSVAGFFMVKTRLWEFAEEIAQTRDALAQLRERESAARS